MTSHARPSASSLPQPLYFVRHADNSYSQVDPQPSFISGSPDKPIVANEFAPVLSSAGDDSAEEGCALQQ